MQTRELSSQNRGRLLRRLRDAVHDSRGAAAIEFGIMIPLLSLMVVSVTDIGLAVYRKMQVENRRKRERNTLLRAALIRAALPAL